MRSPMLQSDLLLDLFCLCNFRVVLNHVPFQDMSEIAEKQLVLYAQMANLVNVILQWPDLNLKEVAENFSKVFH